MKKLYLLLCLSICLCLIGKAQIPKMKVVATTTFLADLAKNIAGDKADVISLMPTGGDPHLYDPIPGDAKKIAEADVILRNGLTLEGWLDELIENSGTRAKIYTLTEGIIPIKSVVYEDALDPHAWMDVKNGIIYTDNILRALIESQPTDQDYFESQHAAYKAILLALDVEIKEQIAQIPAKKRVLVTSHDAFRYYGNAYGLEVVSAMGTSTDAEPTLEDLAHLSEQVKENDIPAIFIESTINPEIMEQRASDLGIRIGGKLFADSLGDEESGADTYVKMLRQNTRLILDGLARLSGTKEAEEDYNFLFVILGIFALSFVVVVVKLRIPSREDLKWENYKIDISGLSVSYDRKSVLSNIHLTLEPGYVYGLLGGNGSGKSTMFKSILGLIPTDSGSISIHGEEVESVQKFISYIPQKEEIDWSFPATVFDIVLMGRYPHRKVFERLSREDHEVAKESLRMMGIEDLAPKQIGELSGGQQQRAFIARALCQDAEIYLFDEPFVGVDITTEAKIIEIVKNLAKEGKLVVIIHHDLAKVNEYFDKVIMINQRLVAFGDTEEVFTDENIKKTYGGRLTILQQTENQRQ
ncbi:MAG: zinc ABC transporter substrate-binding protein [Bacteroidia bacterium]|nr:zinc ABC transporter substrate-binding protein [Bacteroidia bacterium]